VDAESGVEPERGRKTGDFDGAGGLKCLTPPPTSNGTTDTLWGVARSGKSVFHANQNIPELELVRQAENAVPVIQPNTGNFARIVDAGKVIGIDRATGQSTTVYTVITNSAGKLVTAFPGRP
jgi:hypothetical protein